MEIAIYLIIALFLLLLNAFFVLAEFAAVKARPTRMEELADEGNSQAKYMLYVQSHIDEFLSVCQLGITFASIGLGFVGEPAFAKLLAPFFTWAGNIGEAAAHGVAITIAYIAVSFLHIVLGEQIPKCLAIRRTDQAALLTAFPMKFFHALFFIPLWGLNLTVALFFKLMRIPFTSMHDTHSEGEVRIILEGAQNSGQMSFHQLLLIENVLDLKDLRAKDAMRPRNFVKCLDCSLSIEENLGIIRSYKFSRYPLLEGNQDTVTSFIHVKDLLLSGLLSGPGEQLKALARALPSIKEESSLEGLLSNMQRRGIHMALVNDSQGKWIGMLTLEDLIEELTGIIEEEFPFETPVYLSDYLKPAKTILNIPADSIISAVKNGMKLIPQSEFAQPLEKIIAAVEQREKLLSSYIGKGLAIPHARIETETPFIAFFRLAHPIPSPTPGEDIKIIFLLISPANIPRLHQIFLSRIARIMESEFLEDRLIDAKTPEELCEVIRVAELSVIS